MKKYRICDMFQFIITMIIPILLYFSQMYWYYLWMLCDEYVYDNAILYNITNATPYLLVYAIINSHCMNFCKYHRMMMYGVLSTYIIYYALPNISVNTHNILTLIDVIIATIGFIVTMYRFSKQIFKYIRKINTLYYATKR